MSYEYKELLKAAAIAFLDGTLQQDSETGEYLNLGEVEETYSEISIELDHVYAQEAKADEYEAKANAFDRIKAYSDKAIKGEMQSFELAEGVIDVVEQYYINRMTERGGSDE